MTNVKAVKCRMVELGIRSKDLAEVLGVTPAYANSLVNGKRVLTLKMATRLQKALEVPDEEFCRYFAWEGGVA